MRVTNQMVSNRMLNNINRNMELLDKYNTQASTGKKIQVPSDDPIIASRALRYRTMISENEQYIKNSSQAESWIDTTETVFTNINNILKDMKGIATQAASDTYDTEDRKKLMTDYKSLMSQLEQEFNTSHMGRKIFSGFRTDTNPITTDADGNNILNPEIYGDPTAIPPILSVDGQEIEVQVGSGVTTGINTIITDIYSVDDFNNLRLGVLPVDPVTGDIIYPAPPMIPDPNNPGGPDIPAYPQPTYTGTTEFDRIYNFIGSDEYNNMTSEQKLAWEKDPNNDIRGMMSEAMTTIEEYQSKVSVEETTIGVKSKRVELVQTRLQDNNVNYTTIMSENEDIDIATVMMNFNTADAAYMASLNVGMKINQMTLADYLR